MFTVSWFFLSIFHITLPPHYFALVHAKELHLVSELTSKVLDYTEDRSVRPQGAICPSHSFKMQMLELNRQVIDAKR